MPNSASSTITIEYVPSSSPNNVATPIRSPEDKGDEDEEWEVDSNNAHNWPVPLKWITVAIVSLYAGIPVFATTMISAGLPEIAERFHIHNSTTRALVLVIALLTYVFGPLVLVPLSEMYGRVWVLNTCCIFAALFNLGCAFAPNKGTLIAFRALFGFVGGVPPDVAVGVVSDIFPPKSRATPVAMYHIGSMIGSLLGPISGGFIAQTTSPEWIFIVITAMCAFLSLFGVILLRETYAPVIRMRQARRENNPEKAARVHPMLLGANADLVALLRINLTRPLILLFKNFICFILSIFGAFLYGILYLMLTTFPVVFSQTYGFRPGAVGLAYCGLSVGLTSAMIVGGKWADYVYSHLAEKNGGKAKPEMRMPSMIPGSILISLGILWYGWSAQEKLHWIMPIIGSAIFSFGLMTAILPITLYLADAFKYAASALAAASVFRSLLAFAFPLFGNQVYAALGQGGANSMLAGLALVLGVPFPIWIYYKGEAMRAGSPLTNSD